jgi:hypothetical protein
MHVHARLCGCAVTGPRGLAPVGTRVRVRGGPWGPTSARARVRVNAIFTARTWFLPRPWVNADAGGRSDEKDVQTDIFIQKRPL